MLSVNSPHAKTAQVRRGALRSGPHQWLIRAAAVLAAIWAANGAAQADDFDLETSELYAEISITGQEVPLPVGSSIFAKIKLSTGRSRDKAELLLDASGGAIVAVSGRGVKSTGTANATRVTISQMRRARPDWIQIEMRLGNSGTSRTGDNAAKPRTKAATLRITLRDPKLDEVAAKTRQWSLADCAGDYYRAITAIRAQNGGRLNAAQKRLRSPDSALPGRWIFAKRRSWRRASRSSRRRKRVCLRHVDRGGRRRCAKWGDESHGVMRDAAPTRQERALFAAMDEFVTRRGYAPEFGDNGRYRWLTLRTVIDLGSYMSQPPNPGLCSGGPQMLTFYKRNLGILGARAKKVGALAKTAREQAQARVEAAFAVADEQARRADEAKAAGATRAAGAAKSVSPVIDFEAKGAKSAAVNQSTPGPDGAPAPAIASSAPKPDAVTSVSSPPAPRRERLPDSYAGMIKLLAPLILPPGERPPPDGKSGPLEALKQIAKALRSPRRAAEPEPFADAEVTAAVTSALRTLEGAIYADMLNSRYTGITGAIYGTMNAIGKAHKKTCRCE